MAYIKDIEYYLPEDILSNDELSAEFKSWTSEKIKSKTGIDARHVCSDNETALDLARNAAEKLFEKSSIKRNEIDFLILATQSPEYKLPTTACILQDLLGLEKSIGAFDFNLGCSAYIYGLAIANGLVTAGTAKNVLLITAETYSKYINKGDKSTRTIFGDGAAATVVSNSGFLKIESFDLGTDGSGKDLLIVPAGGARCKCNNETKIEEEVDGNKRSKENLFMDGTGIFEFSLREVPPSVERVLIKSELNKDDVDLYIFHQANKFMLDFLRKQMKIPSEKFYMDFSDTGNTVSSSIPIALCRAYENKMFESCKKVVLSGFGVGLSWGSVMLEVNGGIL